MSRAHTPAMPAAGQKLEDHPIAQIFPMMNATDRAELARSIKQNGLREKIVLLDGKILDGRNRWEACLQAEVEPEFRIYDFRTDGKSPTQFVLDQNLTRRHLTTSQLAAIGVEALPYFQAEARERQETAGARNLVSTGTAAFIAGAGHTGATPRGGKRADEHSQETGHDPAEESQATPKNGSTPPGKKAAATKPRKTPAKASKPTGGRKATGQGAKATGTGKPGAAPARSVGDPKPPTTPAPAASATTKGRARDLAAATVGVSGTLVGQAQRVKNQAPAKFEQIKAGTMSVNAAVGELAGAKKRQAEYEAAIGRIEEVCGHSLAAAAKEGTRLKGKKEVVAYAALDNEKMLAIRGLIEDGWKVAKAVKYKMHTLSRTHRISDLLARAAAQNGIYTLEIPPFVITVERKAPAK